MNPQYPYPLPVPLRRERERLSARASITVVRTAFARGHASRSRARRARVGEEFVVGETEHQDLQRRRSWPGAHREPHPRAALGSATRRQLPPRVAHRRRRSRRRSARSGAAFGTSHRRPLASVIDISSSRISGSLDAGRGALVAALRTHPDSFSHHRSSTRPRRELRALPTTRRACGEARPLPPGPPGEGTGEGEYSWIPRLARAPTWRKPPLPRLPARPR